VSNRRTARRWRALSACIAIFALLIDALLPTAVSAAAAPGASAPSPAFCGALGGAPNKPGALPPSRHCALCCSPLSALPPGRNGVIVLRLPAEAAYPASISSATPSRHLLGSDAQPRAPPRLA